MEQCDIALHCSPGKEIRGVLCLVRNIGDFIECMNELMFITLKPYQWYMMYKKQKKTNIFTNVQIQGQVKEEFWN